MLIRVRRQNGRGLGNGKRRTARPFVCAQDEIRGPSLNRDVSLTLEQPRIIASHGRPWVVPLLRRKIRLPHYLH